MTSVVRLNGMKQQSLIGTSDAMHTVLADVESAARSDAKVLITGETGVGKEVVARLDSSARAPRRRGRSSRSTAPACRTRCSNRSSSATCAAASPARIATSPACCELAHGGTVFLDEVGEMSLRMQALLLRFLETGEIQRVGARSAARARQRARDHGDESRSLEASVAAGSSAKICTTG